MRANVITVPSVSSFDYMLYPEQNPVNRQYIETQLNNYSHTLTDIGRNFVETSRAIYEKINDSTAVRAAKAAVRMAKGLFHPNTIVPLETLEELRAAQPVMQRWVMAEPTIRQIYHKQRCDGYSDTYLDYEPGKIGDQHYDYRRVMDGIIVDTVDENGNDSWEFTTYSEELRESDRELEFHEQKAILGTWDIVKMFVEAGEDISNIFGGATG